MHERGNKKRVLAEIFLELRGLYQKLRPDYTVQNLFFPKLKKRFCVGGRIRVFTNSIAPIYKKDNLRKERRRAQAYHICFFPSLFPTLSLTNEVALISLKH